MAIKPTAVEQAESRRHYAPLGIAALLAPIVRPALRRHGAALASLLEDWAAIVGPDIASRSLPVKCAGGTLTLGCAGPDALELQHIGPALIDRVNLALGGTPVNRLRFTDVSRALGSAPRQSGRLGHQHGNRDFGAFRDTAALPDGPLGEALGRLRLGMDRNGRGLD